MSENAVYIGNKPLINYAIAVVTQFVTNNAKEVVIKARGRAISRAVDVAEVVRNRFLPDVKVKDIKIGTEELTDESGKKRAVSIIEITLERGG